MVALGAFLSISGIFLRSFFWGVIRLFPLPFWREKLPPDFP
jgi:hypothetical protein